MQAEQQRICMHVRVRVHVCMHACLCTYLGTRRPPWGMTNSPKG